jgi:peroxiredoxin
LNVGPVTATNRPSRRTAAAVDVGDRAPDFTLQSVDGCRIESFTLSDSLRPREFVVLNFYVDDFSPVCTTQLCELSDLDVFGVLDGVRTWGIAPDGPYAHKEFIDEHGIDFPLLCDTAQRVAEAYDVLREEKDGFERVPERSMVLVDGDRRVRYRWVAGDNWDEWTDEPYREIKRTIEGIRE